MQAVDFNFALGLAVTPKPFDFAKNGDVNGAFAVDSQLAKVRIADFFGKRPLGFEFSFRIESLYPAVIIISRENLAAGGIYANRADIPKQTGAGPFAAKGQFLGGKA